MSEMEYTELVSRGIEKNYEGWTIHRTGGDVVVGRQFFYPGEFNPEAEQQLCYEVGGSTEENPWGGPLYPQSVLEQCEDGGLLSAPETYLDSVRDTPSY